MSIAFETIHSIQSKLASKAISPAELANEYLLRISKHNDKWNILLRTEAKSDVDKKIANLKQGKLSGIPFILKDMVSVEGRPVTAASKILKGYISPYEATLAEKIHQAGGIFLGHANQDEFAMGSTNETSAYGPCLNPTHPAHVAGGSSGGSAAAIAADFCGFSIGTDTGGSIRLPASFCGVVGVKPTYGRVSRFGVIAYGSSLDQAGPLTRDVRDAALVSEVICGHDPKDSTSADKSVPEWSKALSDNISGQNFAIPKGWKEWPLDAAVKKSFEDVVSFLTKTGKVTEVDLSSTEHAVPVYYILATSEASSNLSRYDGVRFGARTKSEISDWFEMFTKTRGEGFGYEVKKRIILGTYALSQGFYDAWFLKAARVRRIIQQEALLALKGNRALIMPVGTSTAPKLGDSFKDPLQTYMNDRFTTMANLAGLPAMSVPVAQDAAGLPIGVQVLASPFDEQSMFDTGYALEKHFSWKRPHV